jgi:hypothetical protein
MPSRKQRRRRQKLQRHEYEYVIETEEGEIPVESVRELEERERRSRDGRTGREPTLVDRRGRAIQKPTLRRVLRRTAIFGPILLVFVYLMSGDELNTAGVIANTVILLAFFIPFSYVVDVLVYRMMLRRHARDTGRSQPPR